MTRDCRCIERKCAYINAVRVNMQANSQYQRISVQGLRNRVIRVLKAEDLMINQAIDRIEAAKPHQDHSCFHKTFEALGAVA